MTGIERLRKLTKDMIDSSLWVRLASWTEEDWDCYQGDGRTVNDELLSIADQIEREHAEDCFRMGERAAEDAEAIAWVREHGGLDHVRVEWSIRSNLKRMYEKKKAKVERQQRHIEFVQGKCRERQGHIVELSKKVEEMLPRLMPEGCEWLIEAWPKFEDDAPVKLGDMALIDGDADMVEAVQIWIHGKPVIYGDGGSQQFDKGERVKRPAPKVLDADGVEIREGDRVWSTHLDDPHEWIVIDPHEDLDDLQTVLVSIGDRTGHARPSDLTHRAPVLAADGKPLLKHETVYEIKTGEQYFVTNVFDGMTEPDFPEHTVECRKYEDVVTHLFKPSQLTHQRPDTWERLEDDATVSPETYCVKHGIDMSDINGTHLVLDDTTEWMARDLVRRARALAERERGE